MGKPVSRSVVLASALLALSSAAGAAGLGRLNVLSDLGQPLRAEIDVVAVEKGELDSLSTRLASIETYVLNNLPYPAPSLGLQLSLEMRQSGQPYIVATTAQPINEPFVDILVELTWNGGRILRGYTALIDPPAFADSDVQQLDAQQQSAAPEVAPAPLAAPEPELQTQLGSELTEPVPEISEPATSYAWDPAPTTEAAAVEDAPAAVAPAQPAPAAEPAPSAAASDSYDKYTVRRGDTLGRIAREFVSEDVSLDQMLVLLVRTNPDAFVDGNMNRLKAGKVLQIPGGAQAAAIDPSEARREVRLQTADFNAYREKLAAAAGEAAVASAAGQSASGSLTAPVADAAPAAAEQPKEVVKLSGGDSTAAAGAQGGTRALEEELAARDKTIREQNDRVAMLEKQVEDMRSLLALRSQGLAETQQSAATSAPAAEAEPVPAPQQEAPAAEAAATPQTTAPAAEKPAKPKRPKVVAPAPAPSLTDRLLDQPLYLAGGAAVLGLLGFLGFKAARKRKQTPDESAEVDEPTEQAGPGNGDEIAAEAPAAAPAAVMPPISEDVDPLAEAEIYLAYGRDGQAEEILKEALKTNPRRHEVHLKLLEIYAKRKDVAAFDGVAGQLHTATGGQGDAWLKAARMGHTLDPKNPRYALGAPSVAASAASASGAAALDDRLDFDIGLDETAGVTKTDIDLTRLGATAGTSTDVDLSNLSAGQEEMSRLAQSTAAGVPTRTQQSQALDLDLGAAVPTQEKAVSLDFDFDLNGVSSEGLQQGTAEGMHTTSTTSSLRVDAPGSMEFDLSKISLDEGALDKVEPRLDDVVANATADIDLSSISLDLGTGKPEGGSAGHDDHWYDVQTKFDLAKAYREMGDKEGAREILREVIAEGDNEQQAAAQRVLETLA
ncbi:MAG: LysM peptidoglycan-binding domain-containing protein [Burkholderiales bacterium]|nr:LysM peptidoglycan-binding domain-containing protein [Burkholderiales bacterium]